MLTAKEEQQLSALVGSLAEAELPQVAQRLEAEIGSLFDDIHAQVEAAHRNVRATQNPGLRGRLEEKVTTAEEKIGRLKAQYRAAKVSHKRHKQQSAQDRRSALLSTRTGAQAASKQLRQDGAMMEASQTTARLRATSQLLREQLQHGSDTLDTLAVSSDSLKTTRDEFKGMGSEVDKGHRLLSHMNRDQVLDRVVISVGLLIFYLTVIYIVYSRTIGRFF